MPAIKVPFLFLMVLLSTSCAWHLENTEKGKTDELPKEVQREQKESFESVSSANGRPHEMVGDLERRSEESSEKRQDDLPGIWGRSVEQLDLPQKALDTAMQAAFQTEHEQFRPQKVDESNEVLIEDFGLPGLWGRGIDDEEDEESEKEDEEERLRPIGLWGRSIKAPGLWVREIQNTPPRAPGLWGRGMLKNGPPAAPGLWGREIRNKPPGLWGRQTLNKPPGLWGKSLPSLDTEVIDSDISDKE